MKVDHLQVSTVSFLFLSKLSVLIRFIPDSYLRVTKDLYHSYMYTRRLYDSWSSESSGEPLSLSLRRRAQQMADKQAWFMLNRRARALLEGVKLIQDAQERLVDHLTTYLDVTRR